MPVEPEPVVPDVPAEVVEPDTKATDWEAEAKLWMKRSKDNYAKLKAAEPRLAELDRIVESSKTDAQRKDDELARWQSEAERWRSASVAARIEVLASGEFADPTDAVTALADSGKYLDAGGVIDENAIKADLAEVLSRKPHWRVSDTTTPRAPQPNQAQGRSGAYVGAGSPADAFASILQAKLKN